MGVIKDQSEKMFTGAITTRQFHPLTPTGEYEEVADGVMFYRWFANVTACKTREGLVLIDEPRLDSRRMRTRDVHRVDVAGKSRFVR